jgi:hypothetical protein
MSIDEADELQPNHISSGGGDSSRRAKSRERRIADEQGKKIQRSIPILNEYM